MVPIKKSLLSDFIDLGRFEVGSRGKDHRTFAILLIVFFRTVTGCVAVLVLTVK